MWPYLSQITHAFSGPNARSYRVGSIHLNGDIVDGNIEYGYMAAGLPGAPYDGSPCFEARTTQDVIIDMCDVDLEWLKTNAQSVHKYTDGQAWPSGTVAYEYHQIYVCVCEGEVLQIQLYRPRPGTSIELRTTQSGKWVGWPASEAEIKQLFGPADAAYSYTRH